MKKSSAFFPYSDSWQVEIKLCQFLVVVHWDADWASPINVRLVSNNFNG